MKPPGHRPALAFDATIGLGSNIGDKAANIDTAITLLTAHGDVRLIAASRKVRSAPWGVQDQDWFVNACISVATQLPVRALLERCQAVENDMGRVRRQKWGPRLIDVDILTYRDALIHEPDLVVPHPLITERGFVLVPLRDVAPELKIGGKPLGEWISKLDVGDIVPFDAAK
jgi:2-amino-4-hydroxy-6-hydroxymethyldihydropteridine diphosphokinase